MGAFLEKPKTEKNYSGGNGCGISYAFADMQGWRLEMEDAHVCRTEFGLKDWSVFGVFDGHAGSKVSRFCADNIVEVLEKKLQEEKELTDEVVKKSITAAFLDLDEKVRMHCENDGQGQDHSGTTAIVVLISPKHIYWANCGDSRGILCRNDKVEFATADHKPYNVAEKERIEKAGGTVMMQRVNGSLAVSRALGDFDYKRVSHLPPVEQLVSPEPEVTIIERSPSDEFLVLACDGIYDVMANEDVCKYILHKMKLTNDLPGICCDLLDLCLNKNSRDNMSVILVTFPNAPKVSKEAIEKEKRLQEEAHAKIDELLKQKVSEATDPLDVEENFIIQQLAQELPEEYDVIGKRQEIQDKLPELVKAKFGDVNKLSESNLSDDPNAFTGDFPLDEQLLQQPMDQDSPVRNEFAVGGKSEGDSPSSLDIGNKPDTT